MQKPTLSLNQTLLQAEALAQATADSQAPNTQLGITEQTRQQVAAQIEQAVAEVDTGRAAGKYGFIAVLDRIELIDQVKKVWQSLEWVETLVVIGIGGSDLGARAIQQALGQPAAGASGRRATQVIFHGDSPDPADISRLHKQLDLSKTVFNIVSKSGQTVEIISQYVYWKKIMSAQTDNWQQHFVFTTDTEKGVLRQEADQFGIQTLPVPDDVGGRFSVLTPVGLFPALAMGVDIDQLTAGAKQLAVGPDFADLPEKLAAGQFQLLHQGLNLVVMMTYSSQLTEFGRWFRQLWAESLGKDGRGILPIQARGPADQHSQLQYYQQGQPLQSVLFVKVDQPAEDFPLDQVDLDEVKYLQGHSFHEILNIEAEATALALASVGRPSAMLSVSQLDAFSLGQLFMLFELAVVYLAAMIEVNPFDQPGVEASKQMMYALLGRSGFEETKAKIEQLQAQL